jgi:hypothetical protein
MIYCDVCGGEMKDVLSCDDFSTYDISYAHICSNCSTGYSVFKNRITENYKWNMQEKINEMLEAFIKLKGKPDKKFRTNYELSMTKDEEV